MPNAREECLFEHGKCSIIIALFQHTHPLGVQADTMSVVEVRRVLPEPSARLPYIRRGFIVRQDQAARRYMRDSARGRRSSHFRI